MSDFPDGSIRCIVATGIGICALLCHPLMTPAHSGDRGARLDQIVTLSFTREKITVDYTTRLNRAAAFLEFLRIDANEDGRLSPDEQQTYFQGLKKQVARRLDLRLSGKEVPLIPSGSIELTMPFKKTFHYEAVHPDGWQDGITGELHNENYLNLPGNITLQVKAGEHVDVTYSHPRTSYSDGSVVGNPSSADPTQARQRDLLFRYQMGKGIAQQMRDSDRTFAEQEEMITTSSSVRPRSGPWISNRKVSNIAVLVAGLSVAVLGLGWYWAVPRRRIRAAALAVTFTGIAILIGAIGLLSSGSRAPTLSRVETRALFHELHSHIYKAFEATDEDRLYNILSRGLDGDLLDQVYTELYALSHQGRPNAPRVRIRRTKPLETEISRDHKGSSSGYRVRHRWRAYGEVSHYGHTHARVNEHGAIYQMQRTKKGWRLVDTEVIQNKRVSLALAQE